MPLIRVRVDGRLYAISKEINIHSEDSSILDTLDEAQGGLDQWRPLRLLGAQAQDASTSNVFEEVKHLAMTRQLAVFMEVVVLTNYWVAEWLH